MRGQPCANNQSYYLLRRVSFKALVAAGLDVNVKNNKGLTVKDVLDQAASSGIIDRLKKAIEV